MKIVVIYLVFLLVGDCFAVSTTDFKWERFAVIDGVSLFKAEMSDKGVIPFKAVASIEGDLKSYTCILLNDEQKPAWSPKLKSVKMHKKVTNNTFRFSEYYSTPWPFYDREFLLEGSVEKRGKQVVFKASSFKDKSFADKGHVLANVKLIEIILYESLDKTRIEFSFVGDMGGWITSWLTNIIQKKWPLRFIQALKKYRASNANYESSRCDFFFDSNG